MGPRRTRTHPMETDGEEGDDDDVVDPTRLTSSSGVEDHIDAFLKQAPYSGRSTFQYKKLVRDAGAKWDSDKRKWCAPNQEVLIELLHTGKWTPDCLASADQMLTILEDRQAAARTAAHAKECAERKRAAPTKAQVETEIVRRLGIPTSTPAEVAALAPWKISPELLELSAKEPRLGPRSGFSTAARLYMGLTRGLITADQIGVEAPSRKRTPPEAAEPAPTAHKKLPTLPAFGKRSFSVPRGNGSDGSAAFASQKRSAAAGPRGAYDDELAVEYGEYDPDNQTMMYDTCLVCNEDFLYQFGCDCVETSFLLGV